MTSTRVVVFDPTLAADQRIRGQRLDKAGKFAKLYDTVGKPYTETVKDGSDTTDGSGDVVLDLSDKFSSIENAVVNARGATFHQLQVLDYTPATFTFRSLDAAGVAEGTTLVLWSSTIVGVRV